MHDSALTKKEVCLIQLRLRNFLHRFYENDSFLLNEFFTDLLLLKRLYLLLLFHWKVKFPFKNDLIQLLQLVVDLFKYQLKTFLAIIIYADFLKLLKKKNVSLEFYLCNMLLIFTVVTSF